MASAYQQGKLSPMFRAFAFAAALLSAAPAAYAQPIPPLEHYGDLPAIEEAKLSPSGNHIALLTTMGGERLVRVLDREGALATQMRVGEFKVRAIEWVGDEAILLLRTETDRLPRIFGGDKTEWQRANVIPLDPTRRPVSVFAGQDYMV